MNQMMKKHVILLTLSSICLFPLHTVMSATDGVKPRGKEMSGAQPQVSGSAAKPGNAATKSVQRKCRRAVQRLDAFVAKLNEIVAAGHMTHGDAEKLITEVRQAQDGIRALGGKA
jgi:hypothetical protein